MKNQFTISSAYQWSKDENGKNNSELAIKSITEHIKNRFSNNKNGKFNYNISYRRLRASAGRTMLKSIIKRIEDSQVVIIDLTTENKNVFIELGIALALEKSNDFLSIYLIREKNTNKKLPEGIPSDLQGYFISEYILDKNKKVIFKDNNSLRMSIESDVKEYFNSIIQSFNSIDETTI
ncbi:hypothetical protein [Flagellimonas marinaquae]|uniref:hypothetical protein n=1 Tax=Flagellimonas marinaquae TaxID=254955 RepID=UPI000F8F47E3|nr:hypothetical protein [Allomuricauda aquimarina]